MIGDSAERENGSLSSARLYQETMHPSKAISFFNQSSSRIIVEIIGQNNSTFTFRWLTLKSMRQESESSEKLKNTDCKYKCPEMNVCLAPELLCDGVKHCPSGYDESGQFCSSFALMWTVAAGILAAATLASLVAYSLIKVVRRYKRRTRSVHDINDLHGTGSGGYLTAGTLVGPTMCSIVDVDRRDDYFRAHNGHPMDIYSPIQEFEFRLNRSTNSFNMNNCDEPRDHDSRIYFTPNISRRYDYNIPSDDSFLYFS